MDLKYITNKNISSIKFYKFSCRYASITDIGSLRMDDSVHFHVTDSSGNTLPNQRLKITITPARRQHAPVVAIGEPIVVSIESWAHKLDFCFSFQRLSNLVDISVSRVEQL